MLVTLTYFKPSGKFYSTGTYESDKEHMFEVFDQVRLKQHIGMLPDIVVGGGKDFTIHVTSDSDNSFPALIHPEPL